MLPNVCVCMNQLLKVIPEKWIFSIFNKLEVIGFCQNPYCYRVCKSWLLGVGNRSWKQKHKTSTKEAFFFLFFLKSCGWNVWKNGKIFLFLLSLLSLFLYFDPTKYPTMGLVSLEKVPNHIGYTRDMPMGIGTKNATFHFPRPKAMFMGSQVQLFTFIYPLLNREYTKD